MAPHLNRLLNRRFHIMGRRKTGQARPLMLSVRLSEAEYDSYLMVLRRYLGADVLPYIETEADKFRHLISLLKRS